MNRRSLCVVLAALPLSMAASARAQSNAPFRIAWVTTDRKDTPLPNLEAFREGLRDLGYVEGRSRRDRGLVGRRLRRARRPDGG